MKGPLALAALALAHSAQAEPLFAFNYEKMFVERADDVVVSKSGDRILELRNGVSVTAKVVGGVQEYTAFDSSDHIAVGCLVSWIQAELAVAEACPEIALDHHVELLTSLADRLLIFYADNSIPTRDLRSVRARFNVGLKATADGVAALGYCDKLEVSHETRNNAYPKLKEAVEHSISLPRLPVRAPCSQRVSREE